MPSTTVDLLCYEPELEIAGASIDDDDEHDVRATVATAEPDAVTRAFECPFLLGDERVVKNMLAVEGRYLLERSYFGAPQPEILPYMREMVVSWMLEVFDSFSL